jgi:hypothetical protein
MTKSKRSVSRAGKAQPKAAVCARSGGSDDQISTADRLVELAKRNYRFGVTMQHEPFAVLNQGANIALMLKGGGDALRARLSHEYYSAHGRTPSSAAMSDAITVLQGAALHGEPEDVHLRLAGLKQGIAVDLGDKDGRSLLLRPAGWEVADRAPVIFRRTALTAELPLPERGGSLDELRDMLNVTQEGWSMIVGWLVAAFLPSIAHPILLLNGLQGAGKSFAARLLVDLVDPSTAPLRSEPRDIEQWHTAAAGSWVVAVDNLSQVPAWYSDALCKAVTGDGVVRRKLFTDGELAVQSFRRAIILTSIDAGSLRDDLGERLLFIDMGGILEQSRRTEADITTVFRRMKPQLFGALLDAVCAVLATLPEVKLTRLPRMADFAHTLAALDKSGITAGALAQYEGQRQRVAADVIEGDVFATALTAFALKHRDWQGTATQLLHLLQPPNGCRLSAEWPKAPNRLRGLVNRLIPALRAVGIEVEAGKFAGERLIRLWVRSEGEGASIVHTVQPAEGAHQTTDDPDDPDGLWRQASVAAAIEAQVAT